MKPATQRARETAERILAMQSDRTNASLTVRSIPDVVQSAMDMQTAEALIFVRDALAVVDTELLVNKDLKGAAGQICRLQIWVEKRLKEGGK